MMSIVLLEPLRVNLLTVPGCCSSYWFLRGVVFYSLNTETMTGCQTTYLRFKLLMGSCRQPGMELASHQQLWVHLVIVSYDHYRLKTHKHTTVLPVVRWCVHRQSELGASNVCYGQNNYYLLVIDFVTFKLCFVTQLSAFEKC